VGELQSKSAVNKTPGTITGSVGMPGTVNRRIAQRTYTPAEVKQLKKDLESFKQKLGKNGGKTRKVRRRIRKSRRVRRK
jgi:hypothetical protein